MPRMKYFQNIAAIRNHVQGRIIDARSPILIEDLDPDYGLANGDTAQLKEEIDALEYLLSCQHGYSTTGETLTMADYAVYARMFTRHHRITKTLTNTAYVKNLPADIKRGVKYNYKREMDACEYYLEKLKDPEYLAKLPKVIKPLEY